MLYQLSYNTEPTHGSAAEPIVSVKGLTFPLELADTYKSTFHESSFVVVMLYNWLLGDGIDVLPAPLPVPQRVSAFADTAKDAAVSIAVASMVSFLNSFV